jgi:hypothetical protein
LDWKADRCQYDEMRNGNLRSARRTASLKVLPCAALAAALGLGACGSSGSGSGTTTSTTVAQTVPPGAEATPGDTVSSYLGALSRHDFGLAMKFLQSKVQKSIVASPESGFEHLVSLEDIKLGSTQTGTQYRPAVAGDSFTKDSEFARVTVSYSVTFSSGSGSGSQVKTMTLGEKAHARWLILLIQTS